MSETAKAATGSTREQIIAKFEKERTKVSKEIYDNISLLTNLTPLIGLLSVLGSANSGQGLFQVDISGVECPAYYSALYSELFQRFKVA